VPPSLLATALVLQAYDDVSDEEATRRAAFDLQWKVPLGIELVERPFAKSTLQEFRAQLIVHEQTRAISNGVWRWPSTAARGKRVTRRISGNT